MRPPHPPFGIVVRNVLAVIAATALCDIVFFALFGRPASSMTFVLMAAMYGVFPAFAYFFVGLRTKGEESLFAYLIVVVGIPTLLIVAMYFAARVGIDMPHLAFAAALYAGVAALATLLRSYGV